MIMSGPKKKFKFVINQILEKEVQVFSDIFKKFDGQLGYKWVEHDNVLEIDIFLDDNLAGEKIDTFLIYMDNKEQITKENFKKELIKLLDNWAKELKEKAAI